MAHGVACFGSFIGPKKNVSRTTHADIAFLPSRVNTPENAQGAIARPKCGFVSTGAVWRYGDPDPFCNEPALPGSSYCAAHARRCAVAPASSAGHAAAAALMAEAERAPEPPPELAFLAAGAVPEPTEFLSDMDRYDTHGIRGETAAELE